MFQKRCEQVGTASLAVPGRPPVSPRTSGSPSPSVPHQKKKQYDVDLQRFLEVRGHGPGGGHVTREEMAAGPRGTARLNRPRSVVFQSLPEEERERVMTEEKMCGARVGGGVASSPHRARSPSVKVPPPSPLVGRVRPTVRRPASPWALSPGAAGGGGAGAVVTCRSAKRETGREEVGEASRDAKNSRGDVAAQRDRGLPGQIQSKAGAFDQLPSAARLPDPHSRSFLPNRATAGRPRWAWRPPGSPWRRRRRFPGSRGQRRTRSATRFAESNPAAQSRLAGVCCNPTGVPQRELLEMRTLPAGQSQRKQKFDGEPKKPPV